MLLRFKAADQPVRFSEQPLKESVPQVQSAAQPVKSDKHGVREEIRRTEILLAELTKQIDDPKAEFAKVMRQSNECRELQAYVRGLRFLIAAPEKY